MTRKPRTPEQIELPLEPVPEAAPDITINLDPPAEDAPAMSAQTLAEIEAGRRSIGK